MSLMNSVIIYYADVMVMVIDNHINIVDIKINTLLVTFSIIHFKAVTPTNCVETYQNNFKCDDAVVTETSN